MREPTRPLPDPTAAAVATWLKHLQLDDIHREGWVMANQRFHGITLAMRTFVNQHYDTPELQEAAFDGLTIALVALARFNDIDLLNAQFNVRPPLS